MCTVVLYSTSSTVCMYVCMYVCIIYTLYNILSEIYIFKSSIKVFMHITGIYLQKSYYHSKYTKSEVCDLYWVHILLKWIKFVFKKIYIEPTPLELSHSK